jgi:hypothetical protein
MPFNVADFNSQISRTGIAAPSHFEGVIVRGPGGRALPGLDQGMRFRIEALNMPGRTLTALDQNYHGPVRSMPYKFTVQPVSLTVILSRDMREREAFMKWQDYMIGHSRTSNAISVPGMFDSKYYDDGWGEVQIWQYSQPTHQQFPSQAPRSATNQTQNQTPGSGLGNPGLAIGDQPEFVVQNTIRLIEAYPTSVNDIALSWGDEGYAKLQIEMKYRYAVETNRSFTNTRDFTNDWANNRVQY